MSGRSIVLVIFSLTFGILTGRYTTVPVWSACIPVLLAAAVYFGSLLLTNRNPFRTTHFFNELTSVFLFLGIGLFSACLSRPTSSDFNEDTYDFQGRVVDYTLTNYGDKLLVELQSLRTSDGKDIDARNVKAQIILNEATDVSYGDFIKGKAELRPYDAPGNYLKQDYESYLNSKHIYLLGRAVPSDCHIEGASPSVLSWFRMLRDDFETTIETTHLGKETKAFLISFLLGDKTFIKNDDRTKFADAGVAHIFAVSGFHVGLVAFFIISILSVFFTGNRRRWKFLLALPFVWFYVLLVGASPATCRAGIMFTIGMTALFLQRKNNPLFSLGWAVVLILSLDSEALFDVGFQLSVVCVGSLLLIAQPLNFIDHRRHPRLFKLVSAILVTLVASFSSWIICAFYFHRFSLIFLPLNLIAVPLLPVYIALALVYLFLAKIGISVNLIGKIIDSGFQLFSDSADYLTSLSPAFSNLHPGISAVLFWVAGLALLGFIMNRLKTAKKITDWLSVLLPLSFFAISLAAFFMLPHNRPSGIILQKNNRETSVMCYENGRERLVVIPDKGSSLTELNGKRILTLRSGKLNKAVMENLSSVDIIILCEGCKELPDNLLAKISEDTQVVVHPSLHWSYDRKIKAKGEEHSIPIHSLRYDGPLHLFD